MKRHKFVLFGLVGALLVIAAVADAGMLSIDRIESRNDTLYQNSVTGDDSAPVCPRCFTTGRARENLLGLERDKPFGLPKKALAADEVDTITILAIRVDFALENPDDPLTTGNGRFDLSTKEEFFAREGHLMDPAPHNKAYFTSHLRALSEYYTIVSHGKLHLEYEIWPQEEDSSFHLPQTMSYYGGQSPAFGLGEFFYDAIMLADTATDDSFRIRGPNGRKKAVMIFHAGADQQTNLSFTVTNTPNDFYTGFLTFDEYNEIYLSKDTVVEGIIMPETMSQDNRYTVMNAVMAHEFGHQLGLVDLYNTGSSPFLTQLGDFALMDNNGMNTAAYFDIYGVGVFGTVPLFPSAWSRAYLGFDEVVEIKEGTDFELSSLKLETGNKIYKIPISATEYYLVENRRGDVDGGLDGLLVDDVTEVILYPAKNVNGEKIPVPEYDVYIPNDAAGMAVWHVDELAAVSDNNPWDIFPSNFEANTLQWDRTRRFVSLVEADGIIDFGGNYYRGYGTPQDLFYAGNNTTFGTYTNPPTISNDGGYSHIKIDHISEPGLTMTFDVTREDIPSNFPRRLSIPADASIPLTAADLNGDGASEILAVSKNRILAVTADGASYLDPLDIRLDWDTIYSPITATTDVNSLLEQPFTRASMPIFAEVDLGTSGNISIPPVVAEFNDTTVVFVGTESGGVYAYLTTDNQIGPDIFHAELLWSVPSIAAGAVEAIIPDTTLNTIHILHAGGYLISRAWDNSASYPRVVSGEAIGGCRFSGGMALLFEREDSSILYRARQVSAAVVADTLVDSVIIEGTGFYAPLATDFDRDATDDVLLVSRDGEMRCFSFGDAGIEEYTPLTKDIDDAITVAPVVADYTDNGFADVILAGTNKLYGFDRNGLSLLDFPMTIDDGRPGQKIISTPIISDVNGDEKPDLVVTAVDSIKYTRPITLYFQNDDSLWAVDTTYSFLNYFTNIYAISQGVFRIEGFPVSPGAYGLIHPQDTVMGVGAPVHIKDGVNGLLAAAGADGWLYAWQCGWSDKAALWTMAGGKADASGYVSSDDLGAESALAEFLPENRFFNYPNPATGQSTTIHYYVNQPASIKVTIFDALGDKVTEMTRDVPDGNREDEIIWDLTDIASGVYHCRLEASALSGSETTHAFTTIAVVK